MAVPQFRVLALYVICSERECKMSVINARGWECPKPVIETKRFLDASGMNEVTTIVDNQIAVDNMTNYAKSQGFDVTVDKKDNVWYVHVVRGANAKASQSGSGDLVIVITTNKLGNGSDDLGENLMKSYLYALTEAAVKPKTLIFMNGGVFLTTNGSAVLESLDALELTGVEIISCGACLNFFGLENEVAVGSVSNMYNFVVKMNEAQSTIVL